MKKKNKENIQLMLSNALYMVMHYSSILQLVRICLKVRLYDRLYREEARGRQDRVSLTFLKKRNSYLEKMFDTLDGIDYVVMNKGKKTLQMA